LPTCQSIINEPFTTPFPADRTDSNIVLLTPWIAKKATFLSIGIAVRDRETYSSSISFLPTEPLNCSFGERGGLD
jgi:hypothetical protein